MMKSSFERKSGQGLARTQDDIIFGLGIKATANVNILTLFMARGYLQLMSKGSYTAQKMWCVSIQLF